MNTFLTVTDPIAALLGPWSASLTAGAVVLRIALAAVLAAVIGWERSAKRHAAGLRTFLLVGLAAASAMLIDTSLSAAWGQGFPLITAAAVVGAAMISGGSVLFSSRSQIKGLTTSAGLWACGLVGAAAGAGLYTVALAAFAALLGGLSLLPSLERYLKNRSDHFEIHLELSSRASLRDFVDVVRRLGLRNRRHRGQPRLPQLRPERVLRGHDRLRPGAEGLQDPPGDHPGPGHSRLRVPRGGDGLRAVSGPGSRARSPAYQPIGRQKFFAAPSLSKKADAFSAKGDSLRLRLGPWRDLRRSLRAKCFSDAAA